ncbi:unnamed protein product [Onchocerca flexuosa]|uniref:Uncharacterized protein n=1 Tax=Onchocerca flexuosa TaxID=387005 RepID=A0A183HTW7_9BILA|nr:unnamed protein product [Onchocerca flexuosa]
MMTVKLYHQETNTVEGALDIHLDKNGRIYRLNNRPVSCYKIFNCSFPSIL